MTGEDLRWRVLKVLAEPDEYMITKIAADTFVGG